MSQSKMLQSASGASQKHDSASAIKVKNKTHLPLSCISTTKIKNQSSEIKLLKIEKAILQHEIRSLKETFNNMIHGVVMFNKEARLVVCNDRYIDMHGFSRDVVRPGCTLQDLLKCRKDAGYYSGNIHRARKRTIDSVNRGQTGETYLDTHDHRTIRIIVQPLADGGWVVTHEDVTLQKRAEAQLDYIAQHDALTDLPNRLLFRTELDQALRWATSDQQLAVLFLDLDNFKRINDTLGHQVGDELLKMVADRLRGCIQETDTIARLGGDEFAIVQTKVKQDSDVALMATQIREALVAPYDIFDHQVVIDTSIGISLSPSDGTEAEQLIKNADMALYGAKARGRGTYHFFEQEMDARMLARHALELDLRKALVKGELEIYYQPLVNIERNEISCCEALLRWHHPKRGMIGPDKFIPVAEEIGLITQIGEWVLRTACLEAAKWPNDITIAINVSPVQFKNNNLVQVVANALATSGISADRLEIEITETILMENTKVTLTTLRQLHALGVKIAMDDFGTGYSSLSYLQKFPFDKIKIDQSFIQGLSDEVESTAIVRAVTSMAKSFKMTTTAEGVETDEQLDIVRALGCTEMQGWLFAKACSAKEIGKLIHSSGAVSHERKAAIR